jgi:5'-nucleotidase
VLVDKEGGDAWGSRSGAFPSGHTSQAFWQGTALATLLPELSAQILARTAEAGDNRIVIGAHYALDVISGRMMGQKIVQLRLADPEFAALMDEASEELHAVLEDGCGDTLENCIAADEPYLSTDEALAYYEKKLGYGFPLTGETGQPVTVPAGAESLLRSSHPELTDEQRRQVLALTATDSGHPLDEGEEESWQRLNLAAAMNADVTVNEDGSASLGTTDDGTTDVQVLTINDFHGRIEANGDEAGAAVLAGAVADYRAANPNTLFASAGDNIGASTFTSFIDDDNPTIDALSAAGLDVSAVGNHEFDQGFADLTDRVLPRYEENTGIDGADFGLGANVYLKGTETPALREYAIREVDGVRIGFIGTVTSDTATLVSPSGVAGLDFGDQTEAANRVAEEIADETDVIVLLAHSGPSGADCADLAAEQSEYGDLVRGASEEIDAIVSGHTHQLYACDIDGRPVIQAHQYGTTLGALDIEVDSATGELVSIAGSTVDLVDGDPLYPADADVQAIVGAAVDTADELGSVEVGKISADILRGGTPPGADRGVESTMGNLVADVYLWATSEYENYGGAEPAQIALMNPGGLRDDLRYEGDGTVTYSDVAAVQPFGNTLVTLGLTGEQLERVLEEQWQPGNERPKLHLGISEGFSYEYIDDAPAGEHIVSMSYLGEPVDATDEFLIVTNSFLASGGDGFTTLAEGVGTADSGLIDLSATVDYFAKHGVVDPAPLGRAVPAGADDDSDGGSDGGSQQPGAWAVIELSDTEVAQGEELQVTVSGLEPGQSIGATLHSDPIVVQGIPAADAEGVIEFAIAIPADFETGAHTLEITSPGLDPLTVDLTVVAGNLVASGSDVSWAIGLTAGALVAGGGVFLAIRRRIGMPAAA